MGQGGKQTCGEVWGKGGGSALVVVVAALKCGVWTGRGGPTSLHTTLTAAAMATPTARTYIVWTKS
jgi:hypothetical protein